MSDERALLPGDEAWSEDNVLLADISDLNAAIARYVLRQLDVDARQAAPMPVGDEQTLGRQLVDLGERVQRRAARQAAQAKPAERAIEVAASQPRALGPGPTPSEVDQVSDLGTGP